MEIFHIGVVFQIFLIVIYQMETAPVNDEKTKTDVKIDGHYLSILGKMMNKPLFELFGRALLQTENNAKMYAENKNITEATESEILGTINDNFEVLCKQYFCGKWTEWSKCSGNVTGPFGFKYRSRKCGSNRFKICKEEENVITEEDTKLCKKTCDEVPNIEKGRYEFQTDDDALVSCDHGFRPTKEKVLCKYGDWEESFCELQEDPHDCLDLHYFGKTEDGVYNITLWNSSNVLHVYCDMTTDGGGWTVFQNRYDGSVDFYRNFSEYEKGFGNLNAEFWLGLKYIQEMANQGTTALRIDLEAANGTRAYETFSSFSLSDNTNYKLHLGPTSSSFHILDDRVRQYHNGQAFTTLDRDLDSDSGNCAVTWHGAWWYNDCHKSNLNGQYLTPGAKSWKGMVYDSFSYGESLKSSKMMLRRVKE